VTCKPAAAAADAAGSEATWMLSSSRSHQRACEMFKVLLFSVSQVWFDIIQAKQKDGNF